jgi:uroporphyrin-III C-methyltransferase/precorrin-2 dehydrogenase/sirohydrochlorin ferrochelatase
MRHLPAFLDLAGRRALVLGSGAMAERRARLLRAAGADVLVEPKFSEALLKGCAIAIGTDAPATDLLALSAAAQARGIPVNIVDRPELCSFIMPAIIDRNPVTIAVSSGGASPVLARLLRQRIERLIPPAIGRLAALAAEFTTDIRRKLPDLRRRRRMLERLLGGPAAELALAGDVKAARRQMAAELAAAEQPGDVGTVFLVGAGPGAGDLLTLRAHRLLGEADVIVHNRLVGSEVLAFARRDAELIDVGKTPGVRCTEQATINALLIRLAGEGRKVVRLKGGDPFIFGRGGEEAEASACRSRWSPV